MRYEIPHSAWHYGVVMGKKEKEAKIKKRRGDMNMAMKLASWLEARNIEDFLDIRNRPWKLIWLNFIIGLSRGVGFLLGATFVGAILIYALKVIIHKLGGMPWLGEQAADFLIYIDNITKQQPGNR